MRRIDKLWAAVSARPHAPVSFRNFEQLLRAFGFAQVRTRGSHRQYAHPHVPGIFSVQPRGAEAKGYQVSQFVTIVEENGLTLEP